MPNSLLRLETSTRITTGCSGLDEVLGGGIPKGSAVFVTGLPGAGKSVLSEQALFANAMRTESVLYVTTLSEPPVKMLQFSREFAFFRPELIERHVRYCDLGDALREGGAAAALRELESLIREHRPEFLVLDSFKVFREHFTETSKYRAFIRNASRLGWPVQELTDSGMIEFVHDSPSELDIDRHAL